MSRGSSSLGGGGFSGGSHGGGGYSSHDGNDGLFTGLILGSLLSRRGRLSGGGDGDNQSPVKYKKVRNEKATRIVSLVMLAITIVFVVLAVVFRFDAVYAQIDATATDYDIKYEYGIYYYYTTYDFDVDGQHYSVESKAGWTKLENMAGKEYTQSNIETYYLGHQYAIYYNKSNPYEIYEVEAKEDMNSPNAIYVFMAVVFGIIAVAIYASGINKYVVDQEYVEAVEKIDEAKAEHKKRKCSYCGSVIAEDQTKCPNCGANLK